MFQQKYDSLFLKTLNQNQIQIKNNQKYFINHYLFSILFF